MHNALAKGHDLALTKKLEAGTPEEITSEDVQEWFKFMRVSGGYLEVEIIVMYLRDVLHCKSNDLQSIRLAFEDVSEDGCVSADDVCNVCSTGDGCVQLQDLHRQLQSGAHSGSHVRRDLLVDKVDWRVDRDEAFSTLPLTLFFLLIFICLVIYHLQIYTRQQVERGLESWIKGYGATVDGPYLEKYVSDVATFYDWLEKSGLPSVFGSVRNGTRGIVPRLAVSSTLMGDVRLEQKHFDGSVTSSWLLHSPAGLASLAAQPGAYAAAAASAARAFHTAAWADRRTSEVILTIPTYHEASRTFALTKVMLLVSVCGQIHPTVRSNVVPSDPYPSVVAYPLDAIFVLLILTMMGRELWEMRVALIGDLSQYWSVWNAIDWVSIVLGLVSCGLWVSCYVSMLADEMHTFLTDGGSGTRPLRPHIMRTSALELDDAIGALERAHGLMFALHLILAANAASIVMRFFKAFQSNQRLNIVAKTFASCYQEIVHFMIVFCVIFLCMACAGHVLFGSSIREFHTIGSSCNTCFMVLMGDFGWYVDLTDTPNFLPSGIPRLLVVIWFFAYMFLVSIVLLNMLLAIILEKYSEVGAETLGPHTRTLWHQAYRYVDRWRRARGDIPLAKIRSELQDPKDPAHPEALVTEESLRGAFGMKDKQARYLMKWLKQEAFLEETGDYEGREMQRLHRTERLLARLSDSLQELAYKAQESDGRLATLEERLSGTKTEEQLQLGSDGEVVEDPTLDPGGSRLGDLPPSHWSKNKGTAGEA